MEEDVCSACLKHSCICYQPKNAWPLKEQEKPMATFQYQINCLFECEARNSDEAYDKFQEMKLSQTSWDNSNGIELIDGEEEWDEEVS